jgi:hypothetical protein
MEYFLIILQSHKLRRFHQIVFRKAVIDGRQDRVNMKQDQSSHPWQQKQHGQPDLRCLRIIFFLFLHCFSTSDRKQGRHLRTAAPHFLVSFLIQTFRSSFNTIWHFSTHLPEAAAVRTYSPPLPLPSCHRYRYPALPVPEYLSIQR